MFKLYLVFYVDFNTLNSFIRGRALSHYLAMADISHVKGVSELSSNRLCLRAPLHDHCVNTAAMPHPLSGPALSSFSFLTLSSAWHYPLLPFSLPQT